MDVTGDSDDDSDDDDDDSDDTDSDDDDSDDDDSDDDDSDDDSDDTDSDDDSDDDDDSGDDSDDTDSDDTDSSDTDDDSDDTDSDDDSDDTDSSDTNGGSSTVTTQSSVSYCASLSQSQCSNAYADDGTAICAVNAVSSNCYAVVASKGMYGSGNYDDGFNQAQVELQEETSKLNTIVGVLGGFQRNVWIR